jgi:ATP-dependent Clp endopeptidase proteolytic subunit ClpP
MQHELRDRLRSLTNDNHEWFRIQAKSDENIARIDLLDEISDWGVTAKDFITELNGLQVNQIDLHINSPGGAIYDGIAIYNALRDYAEKHEAKVVVTVDGVAASAASFVAQAGDEIIMNRHSELMIHDGWGLCMGNAADMRDTAERLDKLSDTIAEIYSDRAGGTVDEWRAAMQEETWYDAEEAVAAGLADRVAKNNKGKRDKNRFDYGVFNFAGRSNAPAPRNVKRNGVRGDNFTPPGQEERVTAEELKALRLPEDATEEQVLNRIAELAALEANATLTPDPPADPEPKTEESPEEGEPEPAEPETEPEAPAVATAAAEQPNAMSIPEGTVLVDKSQWNQVMAMVPKFDKLQQEKRDAERDTFLNAAMGEGRFGAQLRDQFAKDWATNEAGVRATVALMPTNSVPVAEIGYDGGEGASAAQDGASDIFLLPFSETEKARVRNIRGA